MGEPAEGGSPHSSLQKAARPAKPPSLSRCVTKATFATYTKITEKEKEEMGQVWVLAAGGHTLQAM